MAKRRGSGNPGTAKKSKSTKEVNCEDYVEVVATAQKEDLFYVFGLQGPICFVS